MRPIPDFVRPPRIDRSPIRRVLVAPLVAVPLLAALIACGGDDSTGPDMNPDPGDGPISARIDGVPWASSPSAQGASQHVAAGFWTVAGTDIDGSSFRNVSLTLMNIPGPGTYPLGTGSGVAGGTGLYVDPGGGWTTPLSGMAGTVTLTTVNDTDIEGTFSFVAEATTGGATGTRTVTEGRFDLPVTTTGEFDPLPNTSWNTLTATIGGEPWVGSTIVGGGTMGNLIWSANNPDRSLSLVFGSIATPGTYNLGDPGTPLSVTVSGGTANPSECCWGTLGDATGSLTVNSVTGNRMTGTFNFVLQPNPGSGVTGSLTVADGVFDFGLR